MYLPISTVISQPYVCCDIQAGDDWAEWFAWFVVSSQLPPHHLIVTGELRLGHNDPARAGAGSESDHDRSSERSDDLSSRESLAEQVIIRRGDWGTVGLTWSLAGPGQRYQ